MCEHHTVYTKGLSEFVTSIIKIKMDFQILEIGTLAPHLLVLIFKAPIWSRMAQ